MSFLLQQPCRSCYTLWREYLHVFQWMNYHHRIHFPYRYEHFDGACLCPHSVDFNFLHASTQYTNCGNSFAFLVKSMLSGRKLFHIYSVLNWNLTVTQVLDWSFSYFDHADRMQMYYSLSKTFCPMPCTCVIWPQAGTGDNPADFGFISLTWYT